ncbi:MAG: SDR family oxidoreductase [Pirellulales bacterium]|nr:SDR family oxidoreductase [Pirellulales bacterium]
MIEQPVAIVTGAARGIGAAIARRLLADGYAVALVDRDGDALQQRFGDLPESDQRTLSLAGDLAEVEFFTTLTDQVVGRFGRIDLLVNNAAWREIVTMQEITLQSWEQTVRICLTAPAFLARDAARAMQQRGRGVIINIGSMMAQQAGGFAPAYVACKGGLESLTYDLAAAYGPHGIRVVTVSPGAIDAGLSHDLQDESSSAGVQVREYGKGMSMLGRAGSGEEVAAAVAWVASDEASYLTGVTLTLDGGWSRHHFPTPLAQKLIRQGKP